MDSCIGFTPFRDPEADKALCEKLGKTTIERAIVDGQRGYSVTLPNGVRVFYFKLGEALRTVLRMLGHEDDRELLIFGDESLYDGGNVW
jgi:hypothetical protein